jgi:hypothetical protein
VEQKFRAVINLLKRPAGLKDRLSIGACQLRALVRLACGTPDTHGFLRPIEVGRNRLELALGEAAFDNDKSSGFEK